MWEFSEPDVHGHSSIQLQVVNCTPTESNSFPSGLFSLEARQHGAIAVHILVTVYLFFALAIVCDHFFVPAIEKLAHELKIPSSVAGASLMAAAASIPNLATNIIGSLITRDDIGIGAVVGSSFFNVLFIPGAFGLAVSHPVELSKWPVMRDCIAYIISSVLLAIVIFDREVNWYESLVMLLAYVLYILCLVFNDPLEKAMHSLCARICCCKRNYKDGDEKHGLVLSTKKSYGLQEGDVNSNAKTGEVSWTKTSTDTEQELTNSEVTLQSSHGSQSAIQTPVTDDAKSEEYITEEHQALWAMPEGWCHRVCWVLMLPAILVISLVIPDFRRPGCCKYIHYLTLVMSVIFIGLSSYVLVWMISIIGETFSIPSSIMGMTLLAAGGSMPDCLNSVFAAKKGYGDMAFSNAIGSNMFDILFCLSVPWLLDFLFIEVRQPVPIYANMTLVTIFLLTSGVLVLVCTAAGGWTINKKMSVFFIFAYICFIVIDCVIDLRTTLPPCEES